MPELKYTISIEAEQLKRDLATIQKYPKEFGDATSDAKQKSTDAYKRERDEVSGLAAALKAMHRDADASTLSTKDKVEGLIKYYGEWSQVTRTRLVEAHGEFGRVAGEFIPQQTMGMSSALRSFKGSMLSEVPFGGLIGLMMLGGNTIEGVRAASTSAMRIFSQVGDVGGAQLTQISSKVRDLGIKLGKGREGMFGELEANAGIFASFGIQAGEALKKINLTGVAEEAVIATMRIDSLFKLAAGTAARAAGDMVKNFGLGVADASRVVAGMAVTARDAGINVQSFLQSVAASSAVLRTQRVDITEVAAAQLKLKDAIESTIAANMKDPEARRAFATGYAEQAVGQVTRAMAGLSVGMSAVLAERISERKAVPGGRVTGLEAYYAMQEGFGGAGQTTQEKGLFAESIKELAKMAKETGGTIAEQRFFLQKTTGVGVEGSRAILEMAKDIEGGMDINKAIATHQKDLKTAFERRADETSAFQRNLLKAQDGIAKIGTGLLLEVMTGFKNMYWAIRYLSEMPIFGGSAVERRLALAMMESSMKESRKAQDFIMAGAGELGGGVGGIFQTAMGVGGRADEEQMRKKLGMHESLKERFMQASGASERRDLIREEFTKQASGFIGEELGKLKLQPATIAELQKMYEEEEKRTGKGERKLEEEVKRITGGKAVIDAARIEKRALAATQIQITDNEGNPLNITFEVLARGGGLSGMPEKS